MSQGEWAGHEGDEERLIQSPGLPTPADESDQHPNNEAIRVKKGKAKQKTRHLSPTLSPRRTAPSLPTVPVLDSPPGRPPCRRRPWSCEADLEWLPESVSESKPESDLESDPESVPEDYRGRCTVISVLYDFSYNSFI